MNSLSLEALLVYLFLLILLQGLLGIYQLKKITRTLGRLQKLGICGCGIARHWTGWRVYYLILADSTGRIRSAYRLKGISLGTDFVPDKRFIFGEIPELLADYGQRERLTLQETAQLRAAEEVHRKLAALQAVQAV
ncbi:transcriptional regulator GutM [Propionispora hippei]|uniref:Glucitol operon activator protein (GutM) n=1 Tax=Propionispora hippei DSM 15287 TaxID=1123003 RepID=A0A1M6DZJ8_9FIRM|nr:transcriptional regulator GutM [Propionispora hippei]SHI78563.1 Glucitol operon activator protein (GutM) [Propionispora hippei DSM 15287]